MAKKIQNNKASVIIVTYNSADVIAKCLLSIPKDVTVYMVDNASQDNSIEIARKARPDIILIKNKENIGFGRANNLALHKVTTEFAFILNPDTEIQEDTIQNLLAAANKYQDAAIIAPAIYFADGTYQSTYKNSVFKREAQKRDRSLPKIVEPTGDICAECLSGAAMLMRIKLFKKTGYFDENIFLFYEDDDLCLKAKRQGYSLILTPTTHITHLMGKSSPVTYRSIYIKNWHIMWSRLFLEKKYKGKSAALSLAAKEFFNQLGKAIGHLFLLDNEKTLKSISRILAILAFCLGSNAFHN